MSLNQNFLRASRFKSSTISSTTGSSDLLTTFSTSLATYLDQPSFQPTQGWVSLNSSIYYCKTSDSGPPETSHHPKSSFEVFLFCQNPTDFFVFERWHASEFAKFFGCRAHPGLVSTNSCIYCCSDSGPHSIRAIIPMRAYFLSFF